MKGFDTRTHIYINPKKSRVSEEAAFSGGRMKLYGEAPLSKRWNVNATSVVRQTDVIGQ